MDNNKVLKTLYMSRNATNNPWVIRGCPWMHCILVRVRVRVRVCNVSMDIHGLFVATLNILMPTRGEVWYILHAGMTSK